MLHLVEGIGGPPRPHNAVNTGGREEGSCPVGRTGSEDSGCTLHWAQRPPECHGTHGGLISGPDSRTLGRMTTATPAFLPDLRRRWKRRSLLVKALAWASHSGCVCPDLSGSQPLPGRAGAACLGVDLCLPLSLSQALGPVSLW